MEYSQSKDWWRPTYRYTESRRGIWEDDEDEWMLAYWESILGHKCYNH